MYCHMGRLLTILFEYELEHNEGYIDILWEYISDTDVEDIRSRLDELGSSKGMSLSAEIAIMWEYIPFSDTKEIRSRIKNPSQ